MRTPTRAYATQQLKAWLVHRVMWLYYLVVLVAVVNAVAPAVAPFAQLVWFGAILLVVYLGEHAKPVCTPCVRALLAHRPSPRHAACRPFNRAMLRAFHGLFASRWHIWVGWAIYAAAVFAMGFVVPMSWRDGWSGVFYTAGMYFPFGFYMALAKRHHLFSDVCPYCHPGWGDNDNDRTPNPDPVPTGEKVLTFA